MLNLADKGFTVAAYNRTTSKVDDLMKRAKESQRIIACHELKEFVDSLKSPKKILLMVKAGQPVDDFIQLLIPFLREGDIVIDGGNSHYEDTNRRCKELESKKLCFVGCGVSGGEEGARNGPSLMPGGSVEAWTHLKPILQAIAARSQFSKDAACCEWLGAGGAGHFVKMVHNGIEYGDMQLIGEAYHMMRDGLHLDSEQASKVFASWNEGELQSFLIEITKDILSTRVDDQLQRDPKGKALVELIRDVTGQKGTGKWTVNAGLELGVPVTVISEAVQARALSSLKEERVRMDKFYAPSRKQVQLNLDDLKDAIYASKVISYAQGFLLLKQASQQYDWKLDFAAVALLWSGGCIIRSSFLKDIHQAYKDDPTQHILMTNFFKDALVKAEAGWRRTVCAFVSAGLPCPALSSSLAFFDAFCTSHLPANLLQAQRDYFGAHQFELDSKPGEAMHFDWIESGGAMSSTNYQA